MNVSFAVVTPGLTIVWSLLRLSIQITLLVARFGTRAFQLLYLYGPAGLVLVLFGNRTTWRIQAGILGKLIDDDAMAFKKSVQEECTMVSVAAAIVAQIAITGLSLDKLSQSHWVARGFLIFSLTTSLMAVYYATTQQRVMGRLLRAKQVRLWIRGGNVNPDVWYEILALLDLGRLHRLARKDSQAREEGPVRRRTFKDALKAFFLPERLPLKPVDLDPDAFHPDVQDEDRVEREIIMRCFLPAVASVITISAPQMLLSSSLGALLIGFGVYVGFTWTRNLDTDAGLNDSRNVFIVYLVTIGVCFLVYSISGIIQEDEPRSELDIVRDYVHEYAESNPDVVRQWGFETYRDEEDLLKFRRVGVYSRRPDPPTHTETAESTEKS